MNSVFPVTAALRSDREVEPPVGAAAPDVARLATLASMLRFGLIYAPLEPRLYKNALAKVLIHKLQLQVLIFSYVAW